MLVQQIFPINQKLQSEIPLWLKFRCFAYQGFIGRQTGTFSGVLPTPPNQLARIYVPAPNALTSGVNNVYKNIGTSDIFSAIAGSASTLAAIPGLKFIPKITKFLPLAPTKAQVESIKEAVNAAVITSTYFIGVTPVDFTDNIYGGTNKRSYEFKLVFPCLTDKDSFAAFAVARSFEALSAPYATPRPFIYNHPPMWLFGVGPGTGPEVDFTWLTDPQLCVLTNVLVNRSAPDEGSFAVLTQYGLKPSVTTISLKFTEIEPVYRDNLSLISRSQAIQQSVDVSQIFGSP